MLFDDGERHVGKVAREENEQGVAQEGEIGEGVGIAGAGAIFAPEGVALPVIADFHAGPVAADELLPLGGSALVGFSAGKIKPGFVGGFPGGFDRALAAHDDQAADEGEVGLERIAGEGMDAAGFDAAVPAAGFEKKGVPGRALQASACWRIFVWLALTCRRYSPPFSTMARALGRRQCKASAVMVLSSSAGKASSIAVATFCSQRGVPSFWSQMATACGAPSSCCARVSKPMCSRMSLPSKASAWGSWPAWGCSQVWT